MPRDGAKLSEVVFHKSISVFILPLGSGRIPFFAIAGACHRDGGRFMKPLI